MTKIVEPIAAICFGVLAFFALNFAFGQGTPTQNPPVGTPSTSAAAPIVGDTPDGQGNVVGGNPVVAGCIFDVLPTWTVGQIAKLRCNNRGILRTAQSAAGIEASQLGDNADAIAASANLNALKTFSRNSIFNGTTWDRQQGSAAFGTYIAPAGLNFSHIATDTTTTPKSGAGVLHTVCINTVAATGTISVYDSTGAATSPIALIGSTTFGCATYDLAFVNGLTIITAIAAPDVTVTYR